MLDLFGNEIAEPAPVDDYTKRMRSASWRRLRDAKIRDAGNRCERCGASGHVVQLQVHHLDYTRLGHERLADLQVLCPDCHARADQERVERQAVDLLRRKRASALYRGFASWMDKTHGKGWQRLRPEAVQAAKRDFLRWLRHRDGRSYTLDLQVYDVPDTAPDWTP